MIPRRQQYSIAVQAVPAKQYHQQQLENHLGSSSTIQTPTKPEQRKLNRGSKYMVLESAAVAVQILMQISIDRGGP